MSTNHNALTTSDAQLARRIVPFSQIQEQAGVDTESNAITKEQKMQLAQDGTPFFITDMVQDEGDNGPFWIFTIDLKNQEKIFFMGENDGNRELFAAMREAVADGAAVGPMRLEYIPPRTDRKGRKRFGFYKLEAVANEAIDAALAHTSRSLLADADVLPF